ncbi:MAG: AbrB/MazE/SpoVT family DNA-binding domain-containing protein [Betaproteobacteria bacterium]|nr:AbrB/MazE/SpoVT family DNA-binding domain-containing protein [Betaproteobacteria bacterium]
MATVTVSSKYQISIPPEAREQLHIRPGQKLDVLIYDGMMHFVPVLPMDALHGMFRGMEVPYEREKTDRAL